MWHEDAQNPKLKWGFRVLGSFHFLFHYYFPALSMETDWRGSRPRYACFPLSREGLEADYRGLPCGYVGMILRSCSNLKLAQNDST